MKLVIDIPEDVVVDIKDTYTGDDVLYCAVKYGTPLDDIKAEIKNDACCGMNERYCDGLRKALKIIDKHIGERSEE